LLSINKVCDEFIKKNESAIEFYPTSNNFSFTDSAIISTILPVMDESGNLIKEIISIQINSLFVNATYQTGSTVSINGTAYDINNVKFAGLTKEQILYFRGSTSKIDYVSANRSYFTYSTSGNFGTLNSDMFLIAYIESDGGEVIAVAPNYFYVNVSDCVCKLVYINDLLFIDETSSQVTVTPNKELLYNGINASLMFTGNVDADNGKNYAIDAPIRYAVIPSSIFTSIANDVFYGLKSTKDILTSYISKYIVADSETTGGIKILKSSGDIVKLDEYFAEYDDNGIYYLIAFYSDNTDFNSSTYYYYSGNFLMMTLLESGSEVSLSLSVKFFSDDIRFKFSSIGTEFNNDGVHPTFTLSINTDNMIYKLHDYTSSSFINKPLSFMTLSEDDIVTIVDIYNKSNSSELYELTLEGTTFYLKDFTIEQSIEFVLYIIKQKEIMATRMLITAFLQKLISNESTGNKPALLGKTFDSSLKQSSVSITISAENSFEIENVENTKGYVIGFILNEDRTIDIATRNIVSYTVKDNNSISTSIVMLADKIKAGSST